MTLDIKSITLDMVCLPQQNSMNIFGMTRALKFDSEKIEKLTFLAKDD